MTREWIRAAALMLCLALSSGCERDATGRGQTGAGGAVRVMLASSHGAGSNWVATAVDSVVLVATPDRGNPQRIRQTVARRQLTVDLRLSVPQGRVKFELEIYSNNGTLLFSGERVENISRDQFEVTIPLIARAAYPLVRPDSLGPASDAKRFAVGALAVDIPLQNAGSQELDWSFVELQSAGETVRICPSPPSPAVHPCVRLRTGAQGRIAAGETITLPVWITSVREQKYTMKIDTNVGRVEVDVVVPAALSGTGTTAIDGALREEEWAGAARQDFTLFFDDGQQIPATVRVMNDARYLYLALTMHRPPTQWTTPYRLNVEFSNRALNVDDRSAGDDFLRAAVPVPAAGDARPRPIDDRSMIQCDAPNGWCMLPDQVSNDGVYATGVTDQGVTLELRKELSSGDPRDFDLGPGSMVGITLFVELTLAPVGVASPFAAWPERAVFRVQ
jgi:hypothetical protein